MVEFRQKKDYTSPVAKIFVVSAESVILAGSSEGGGGNENYVPRNFEDLFIGGGLM